MGQFVGGAPGVYLQGLSPEPVQPVSGIAGFVGVAARGPLHLPQPIRSWDEYLTVFGDFVAWGCLAHSVFGFFRNGGRRCWVVRAADLRDRSAENLLGRCRRVDLLRVAGSGAIVDVQGRETLRIAAIDEGAWGNATTWEVLPGSQTHLPLTVVTAAAAAGATVIAVAASCDFVVGMPIQFARAGDPLRSQLAVVGAVDSSTDTVTLQQPLAVPVARGASVTGRGFKLVVRRAERTEIFDNLSMSPVHPRHFVAAVNGPDPDRSYIDRQNAGHSILVRVQQVFDTLTQRPRLRPPTSVSPQPLAGGGDGFTFANAAFRDAVGGLSIRLFATPANSETAGRLGNRLRVRASPFATVCALAAPAGAQTIVVADATGIAVGDPVTLRHPTAGTSETHPVAGVTVDNVVTLNTGGGGLTNAYPSDTPVAVGDRFTLAVFFDPVQPATTSLAQAASPADVAVYLDDVVDATPGKRLTLTGAGGATESFPITAVHRGTGRVALDTAGLANAYAVGTPVTLLAAKPLGTEPLEMHRNLSADPASPRYFRGVLAASSRLVNGDGPDVLLQPPVGVVTLVGGGDPGHVDLRWLTGYDIDGAPFFAPGQPGRLLGLASLEAVDEVDLVAAPDLVAQTLVLPPGVAGPQASYLFAQRQLLRHAAQLGDRIALVDTRRGLLAPEAALLPQQLADPQTVRFGALYFPWLQVSMRDELRALPPSGLVAGAIARADALGGAARAPANLRLADVVGVDLRLERGDQDLLNSAAVNLIRRFESPALELWGARSLSTDVASRPLQVRRLVIAVKKEIGRSLLWTVFEPNTPALRQRIESSLRGLMQSLVAGGAVGGGDAFFVQCDDANNPGDVIDAGEVVAAVGFAAAAAAEFIVINVKRTPDAVSVTEQPA